MCFGRRPRHLRCVAFFVTRMIGSDHSSLLKYYPFIHSIHEGKYAHRSVACIAVIHPSLDTSNSHPAVAERGCLAPGPGINRPEIDLRRASGKCDQLTSNQQYLKVHKLYNSESTRRLRCRESTGWCILGSRGDAYCTAWTEAADNRGFEAGVDCSAIL